MRPGRRIRADRRHECVRTGVYFTTAMLRHVDSTGPEEGGQDGCEKTGMVLGAKGGPGVVRRHGLWSHCDGDQSLWSRGQDGQE